MCNTQKTGCLCNGKAQTYVELARDRMFHAETETQAERKTERKHMALPYQVLDVAILCESVNDFGNFYVATLDRAEGNTDQDRATLDFLVLAANSHYDLLTALKATLKMLLPCNPQSPELQKLDECPSGHPHECGACSVRHQVQAAIAKAEPTKEQE